ncbi:MAG: FAD-dependent oxidoreductase [Acutalibacteraceae bacterium]|nr:FAD-dependent oxidoreductase [Acutalibacteraceae bacterium]
MYDIVIIGAGPAGLTSAVYAGRADKKVLIIEKETFGGQITHSPRVENYPGFIQMSGNEFAEKLVEQAMAQGADIELDTVVGIETNDGSFTVKGERGSYEGKSVIIATGSAHRRLGLPKEDKFTGEGVSYCAVCDGAFYSGKDIAVIGGGNSALQEAVLLSKTSKSVTVIQNLAFLTGETKLIQELENKDNVSFVFSSVVTELLGEDSFTGIRIKNTENGEEKDLSFDGIFVAIGQKPENEPFRENVTLNEWGYIEADESCVPESEKGIFVAGDCRSKRIRQIATAISDGAVAALAACSYIDNL